MNESPANIPGLSVWVEATTGNLVVRGRERPLEMLAERPESHEIENLYLLYALQEQVARELSSSEEKMMCSDSL